MIREVLAQEFDRVFALMEASFPTDEYRPYDEQKALLSLAEYRVYVWEEAREISGFAAVWSLDGFSFLEHLAVDPAARNRGIGGKLLDALIVCLEPPLCLEVELPETELAARRIGFYERHGLYFNDYPYQQPAISKGKQPVPLRIMTSGKAVDAAGFERIKRELYTKVYHEK